MSMLNAVLDQTPPHRFAVIQITQVSFIFEYCYLLLLYISCYSNNNNRRKKNSWAAWIFVGLCFIEKEKKKKNKTFYFAVTRFDCAYNAICRLHYALSYSLRGDCFRLENVKERFPWNFRRTGYQSTSKLYCCRFRTLSLASPPCFW